MALFYKTRASNAGGRRWMISKLHARRQADATLYRFDEVQASSKIPSWFDHSLQLGQFAIHDNEMRRFPSCPVEWA